MNDLHLLPFHRANYVGNSSLSEIMRERVYKEVVFNQLRAVYKNYPPANEGFPPFGGSERQDVQQNFPIKTSETAYMFMQHFVKMLKAGGRAGIVIKNTFLSNADAIDLRKMLLEETNLHTILDLPGGVFTGAGVRTVVLFFDKGKATKNIWYYQLNPGRTLGKTTALTEEDMAEFVRLQKNRSEGPNSWIVDVSDLDSNYDLTVRNPNIIEDIDARTPSEIVAELKRLNDSNAKLISRLKGLI